MKKMSPAIIFGDHISAYGVIRGLSHYSIPMYIISQNGNGISMKSRFVKKSIILDPNDELFIDKLNNWFNKEICEKSVLIVAGNDEYLEALSKYRSELNINMKTTFPSWDVVKNVRQKRRTYNIANKLGIPVLPVYYITSLNELEELLNRRGNSLSFPLFMKSEESKTLYERYGVKGIICNNVDELLDYYKKYDGFCGNLLLQDLIPGETEKFAATLITLNQKSQPTGLLINEKIRSSGRFLSGSLVATTWSDTLLTHSLKLLKEIGYYGYASTQFKYDSRDGQFKLLEVNGRVTMSNSLAFKCGINLPFLMYKEALFGPLQHIEYFKQEYPDNVFWWYPAGDLGYILRFKAYLKPKDYIKSLIGGSGYIIEPMNWRDPYPGIVSVTTNILRRGFRRHSRL